MVHKRHKIVMLLYDVMEKKTTCSGMSRSHATMEREIIMLYFNLYDIVSINDGLVRSSLKYPPIVPVVGVRKGADIIGPWGSLNR